MRKIKAQIECLSRLQDLTSQLDSIIYFLKQEGLVDNNAIRHILNSTDKAKEIELLLYTLRVKEKLQLLEYQWTLLPIENIKVYIITDRNQAEFVFNG